MATHFTVEETSDSRRCGLGVLIHGLDLSKPLSEGAIGELRRIALDYPVTVLRGQQLDPAGLQEFARRFGTQQAHTAERYHHPEFRELSYVANVGRDGSADQFGHAVRASGWHSDGSFLARPYSHAMLYALEVPAQGGATLFNNMYLAYERLPEDLRRRVEGLRAVHAIGSGWDGEGSPSRNKRTESPAAFPDIARPVVRLHPETGRKALFVNAMHTSHIDGMDRQEGIELLKALVEFSTRPEFVYEHRWRIGDLVIWDERATMHRAGGGVPAGQRRVLLRTLFEGTPEFAMAA
jgi:taurine dioxygenase